MTERLLNARAIYPIAAVLALAGLLVAGVGYLAVGLIAPAWVIPVSWTVFLGWLALGMLLVMRRSWWVLMLPLLAAATWVGMVMGGNVWLGWNA